MTAGYSCDLALVSLSPAKLNALKEPLQGLVGVLRDRVASRIGLVKDLVLLAHWESQSFWSENYTDLWDFCDCLQRHCKDRASGLTEMGGNKTIIDELTNIAGLCQSVKDALVPEERKRRFEGMVLRADNCGSEFQYARGMSIYFPWCEPLDDRRAIYKSEQDDREADQREAMSKTVLGNYRTYDFTTDFEPSWLSFLEAYFEGTMRERRNTPGSVFDKFLTYNANFSEPAAREAYEAAERAFIAGVLKRTPELKKTPETGGDCTCPSIKNYPIRRFPEGSVLGDSDRIIRQFSITPGALKAFLPIGEEEEREDE